MLDLVGSIHHIERVATGRSLRERSRLCRTYGQGRWRKLKGISRVMLIDGTIIDAELHWYEAHGIGRRTEDQTFSDHAMRKKHLPSKPGFVVCVRNDGYRASLERGKIYRTRPDKSATEHGYVRVVDESGEDYLYPDNFFRVISLPTAVQRALRKTG